MADSLELPESVALIRSFVNTRDVEAGTDRFSTPSALRDWLVESGLLAEPSRVTEKDRQVAISLREALRAALVSHHEADVEPAAPGLESLARDFPLRLAFPAGGPRLEPAAQGVRGAMAALVAAVQNSVAEGTWSRLKICPADDCTWAFYDSSKNRSRTWCSMSVCGNRAKTRTFRARHASA